MRNQENGSISGGNGSCRRDLFPNKSNVANDAKGSSIWWKLFIGLFIGNGATVFYSLSVFCVIYGLAGIMTPLLSEKNVLYDKLICIGTLQGYEILLLLAAVIPFVKKKVTNDSISLIIFIALFLIVGAITLDTISTDGFSVSVLIATAWLLLAVGKLYTMRRSLEVKLPWMLSSGVILLLAWNYLVSPVMARYLLHIAPTSSDIPLDMLEFWRSCWLLFFLALGVVWYYIVSSCKQSVKEYDVENCSFLHRESMSWIFIAVLLMGSFYHQQILSYLYDIKYTFGDFLPVIVMILFISGELIWRARCRFLSGVISDKNRTGDVANLPVNKKATKWLHLSFKMEILFFLLPLVLILFAYVSKNVIVPGSYLTDIIWNPLLLLGCSSALILYDWIRYKRGYLMAPLIGYLAGILLMAGGGRGLEGTAVLNWQLFGGVVVFALILYGCISKKIVITALGTVIAVVALFHYLITKTEIKNFDVASVPLGITLASATILLFYLLAKNRALRPFAVIGSCLMACFVMFCYTGSEWLYLYRISVGIIAIILGIALIVKTYDLPVGAVLTFPLPIYLVISLSEMKSWHYVILGFLLLVVGTLFSICKDRFWSVASRFYIHYTTIFLQEEKGRKVKKDPLLPVMVVLPIIVFFMTIFASGITVGKRGAVKISCMNNLKQIGLALRMYSSENDDVFPDKNGRAGLQMLVDSGFLDSKYVFTCPATRKSLKSSADVATEASYCYAGGMNEASSVDSAIVMDCANNHDKFGNILYVDGHVKGYAGVDWSSNGGGSVMTDFDQR